jgi:CRP-like cAMP-binding protein
MPKSISYNKGSIVYFEGDKDERVFILKQGTVALTSVDIQTKMTANTFIKEPGTFFGIKSAISHCPREETVTVVEPTVCIVLTTAEFEDIFKANKPLIMKMLRIFSTELRQVHKKTAELLNQDSFVNTEQGLLDVAKSFFDDAKWRSCVGACTRLIKANPTYAADSEFKSMVKISQSHLNEVTKMEEEQKKRLIADGEYNPYGNNGLSTDYQDEADRAFDIPAFKRFAKTYNDGEIIIEEYERGETFYLIQLGLVQLVKCVNGTNKNLDILRTGELFGEMAILDNSPRSATCIAKGRVDCLEFNKENFEMLITGTPQIALMLLKLFCKRILDQKRRFKMLLIDDKHARIADVFCMFEENGSMPTVTLPDDMKKKLKIMHSDKARVYSLSVQDIAHWAGLDVQKTEEECSRFEATGRIKILDSYMIISDITDMRRIVDTKLKMMNRMF